MNDWSPGFRCSAIFKSDYTHSNAPGHAMLSAASARRQDGYLGTVSECPLSRVPKRQARSVLMLSIRPSNSGSGADSLPKKKKGDPRGGGSVVIRLQFLCQHAKRHNHVSGDLKKTGTLQV